MAFGAVAFAAAAPFWHALDVTALDVVGAASAVAVIFFGVGVGAGVVVLDDVGAAAAVFNPAVIIGHVIGAAVAVIIALDVHVVVAAVVADVVVDDTAGAGATAGAAGAVVAIVVGIVRVVVGNKQRSGRMRRVVYRLDAEPISPSP